MLCGLEQRSGLIRPCGQNDVEFVHNSLRDYLAALEFVERGEIDFLMTKVDAGDVERWEPILLFAAGSDRSRAYVQSLMEALLTTQGLSAKCRKRREIIVLKAHGRLAFRLTTTLEQQISALRTRMLPINTFKKAEALAEAGDTAVGLLTRRNDMPEKEAAASVRGLGKMNSERAREQLRDYLHSDRRPATLTELTAILSPEDMLAVVSYIEIPSVLAGLQTEGAPEAYRPFIRDLTPLSGMTELRTLNLNNTQVSDLTPLCGMTQLQYLSLNNTQVSDLTPLCGMTELRTLNLNNTQISLEEIQRFGHLRQTRGLLLMTILT